MLKNTLLKKGAVIGELHLLDWDELFRGANINEMVAFSYDAVFGAIYRHASLRQMHPRRSGKQTSLMEC